MGLGPGSAHSTPLGSYASMRSGGPVSGVKTRTEYPSTYNSPYDRDGINTISNSNPGSSYSPNVYNSSQWRTYNVSPMMETISTGKNKNKKEKLSGIKYFKTTNFNIIMYCTRITCTSLSLIITY